MTSLLSLLFILTLLYFILLMFFLLAFKYYFDFSLKNEIFFIQTTIFIITMNITIIIISNFSICFYFLKMKISSFDINCNYYYFLNYFYLSHLIMRHLLDLQCLFYVKFFCLYLL